MILLGDTAQLPPVNLDISPALNTDTLGMHYNKEIKHIELDEVMRQEENSGILYNATELREVLKDTSKLLVVSVMKILVEIVSLNLHN